jgi:nucleotide-binding universal stress UspA family protein
MFTQPEQDRVTFSVPRFGKCVVVGIDPNARNGAAVDWAGTQAARSGRPLRLVEVVAPLADTTTTARARHLLGVIADDLRESTSGLEVQTTVVSGPTVRSLIAQADGESLLVVGRRKAGPFGPLTPGNASVALACESPTPVVVVPDGWRQEHDESGPVVVCVDPYQDSAYPLGIAFTEARRRGAELEVLHVAPEPLGTGGAASTYAALRALESVVGVQRRLCPDVAVRVTVRLGSPETVVDDCAAGAQLLVVGRHRRRNRSLLWASFVPTVAARFPVPVAIIPDRVQLCPWPS